MDFKQSEHTHLETVNRPILKFAIAREISYQEFVAKLRSQVVHEDSSTALMTNFTASVEFPKKSNTGSQAINTTTKPIINKHILSQINRYLTFEDKTRLVATNKSLHNSCGFDFYRRQSIANNMDLRFFVSPQTSANHFVLIGNPKELIKVLQKDPKIFFTKSTESQDATGQIFYNVSPADLIDFTSDYIMQLQVKQFAYNLPEKLRFKFFKNWQAHIRSRGMGGADLVVILKEHLPKYEDIFKIHGRYLLTNPDGIICSKKPSGELLWYYANPANKTLDPIDLPQRLITLNQTEYTEFAASINAMEPWTARRSSNQEYALIQKIMRIRGSNEPVTLVREGIHYERNGVHYIDTHYDFNRLINVYLKYIRLNAEHSAEKRTVWNQELAPIQREVMWLIQRYCSKTFAPLPFSINKEEFDRIITAFNRNKIAYDSLFNTNLGQFLRESGDYFPIFRGRRGVAIGLGEDPTPDDFNNDLSSVIGRAEEAIQNTLGFSISC